MNKQAVARQLIGLAKELVAAETGTFKCPECGTKVLKNTGYCVKCKKKVKEAAETFKCPDCGTKVLKQTGYCVKCKKKVKEAAVRKAGLVKRWLEDVVYAIIDDLGLDDSRYDQVQKWVMRNADIEDRMEDIINLARRKIW